MGDRNAQIGKEELEKEDEHILGSRLGFDTNNENGEEFKVFLHLHKLTNISTMIGQETTVTWRCGSRKKPNRSCYKTKGW